MFDHKMSDEKKEKLTNKLKELGIDESKIDDKLLWSFKKVSFGLLKLRFVLNEAGVDEAKTKEIIDKLVDMSMNKDLAKIKEWHEEHKDKES